MTPNIPSKHHSIHDIPSICNIPDTKSCRLFVDRMSVRLASIVSHFSASPLDIRVQRSLKAELVRYIIYGKVSSLTMCG